MTCNLSYYGLFQRRIMRKMRLIDADKLKEYVNSISSGLLCEWDTLGVLSAIDKQQSIDAVSVVRCKDCVHCEYPGAEKEWCKKGHIYRGATWFCADGERKGGEQNAVGNG